MSLKCSIGDISINATVINQASTSGEGVMALGVQEIDGYLSFLKFRQKYRTIENITRKQEFTLDHRLKITTGENVFYFPLEEADSSLHFFTEKTLKI